MKNDPRACDSLHDQITTYRTATDHVLVVGTPQFMIEYTLSLDALCNPTQVAATIEKLGAALVIYDAQTELFTALREPPGRDYDKSKFIALWNELKAPVLQLDASTP